jgi:hypothetical protein
MPIRDLSDTLIHIWDAINHLKPVSIARKLLYWRLVTETTGFHEVEASAVQVPYPAIWATGVFDPDTNIRWNCGTWS